MNDNQQQKFIPGLLLAEQFYTEAVEPILKQEFPSLSYSAALIGSGSEVLGFDTEMSADHHWGPRVMMFLEPDALSQFAVSASRLLSDRLPRFFRGYPVSFSAPVEENGVQILDWQNEGPINHRVSFQSLRKFTADYLAFDIDQPLHFQDWLSFPEQKLRAITSGKVFRDDIGLEEMRKRFSYYPHDVWVYQLSCCWTRIEQEGHLMGRAGIVGDEVGSALIAARLVRDCMRLLFLIERQYAPYAKWLGTAFKLLPDGNLLYSQLQEVLAARTWQDRQQHLIPVYETMARKQQHLRLTKNPLPTSCSDFHGRPFMVISKGEFSQALRETITNEEIKSIAAKRPIGGIDLFSDNTDLLEDTSRRRTIADLY